MLELQSLPHLGADWKSVRVGFGTANASLVPGSDEESIALDNDGCRRGRARFESNSALRPCLVFSSKHAAESGVRNPAKGNQIEEDGKLTLRCRRQSDKRPRVPEPQGNPTQKP